jgi:hypothetical protein
MIVKFHPRGRGGGAGPVDYLLGKDRQREGASVLQGSRKKSGSLSTPRPTPKIHLRRPVLCRTDLPPGQREKLMASLSGF